MVLYRGVKIQDACLLQESTVEDEAVVGPMAHLRPGCLVHRKAKVGNFVELKKTEVGEGSKVNHLSYLGDTWIGRHVNVGAGTITCNYDGYRKARTVIEDNVFVGSDVQLVAPVTIGEGALIAAGTTVTEKRASRCDGDLSRRTNQQARDGSPSASIIGSRPLKFSHEWQERPG